MQKNLILAEELFAVFNEADEDDNGGAGEAGEEKNLENAHSKDCQGQHGEIVAEMRVSE